MDPYDDHFDREANNGRVLDTDLSIVDTVLPTSQLHPIETDARNAWNTTREALFMQYHNLGTRYVMSREQLLEERVAPPLLVFDRPSTRNNNSERRDPLNPNILHVWDDFRKAVDQFRPTNSQAAPLRPIRNVTNVFMRCLEDEAVVRSEDQERFYLIQRKQFYKNVVLYALVV
jgi:hypothetical protein